MFVHPIDTRRSLSASALLAIVLAFGVSPAMARIASDSSGPRVQLAESASDNDRAAGAGRSKRASMIAPAEAARRASHEYGGRVLNVVLEDGRGDPYYRVKLLDGGRMRVVRVEARR